ncbi:hypothetical protein JHD48_07055 [Sulfurimonas sp. SAG-AH-194-I05]|nr:hypothetical protein [Sulfurimonas sp. SAG-AH-194-I05]MDF1875488.1 hypothetical protein [Sulfurimonas sp. SAG-AH-194-I05]
MGNTIENCNKCLVLREADWKLSNDAVLRPDDLNAKVYKLENSKYDKQGDFSYESYEFKETLCKASIDFLKYLKNL